jgi:hypothetical protein
LYANAAAAFLVLLDQQTYCQLVVLTQQTGLGLLLLACCLTSDVMGNTMSSRFSMPLALHANWQAKAFSAMTF